MEARGAVGEAGLRAGAGVEDDHGGQAGGGTAERVGFRTGEREEEQGEDEQLQQEGKDLAEALEERAAAGVRRDPLPEHERGNAGGLTAELEEVERDDQRRQNGETERGGVEQETWRRRRMRDAGCGMRDAGCEEGDAGCGMRRCGMRDAKKGCGMRDAGCGMRDAGCGMRDAGCGMRDAGCGMRRRDAGCGAEEAISFREAI